MTPTGPTEGWRGELTLHYRHHAGRTIARDRHQGPLRVLQPLYPEGPAICHHVLVHPPGGVVGGDELSTTVHLDSGSHALITTPGATRFYRSEGALATQCASVHLAAHARLEWLPMENIAYSGCRARNLLRAHLAPGAEMMGWDVLALGLPSAGQPFADGWFEQHLEQPGLWLEKARIAAQDAALLRAPLGWAGHGVLATLWFASGSHWAAPRREALLEAARAELSRHALAPTAGATSPQGSVVVLRVLAQQVQAAMQLLMQVRGRWRAVAWGLKAEPPRIWRT